MSKFDITKHKWYCQDDVESCIEVKSGNISLVLTDDVLLLNKDDAIAIAKYFGLIEVEILNISNSDLCSAHQEHCDCFGDDSEEHF